MKEQQYCHTDIQALSYILFRPQVVQSFVTTMLLLLQDDSWPHSISSFPSLILPMKALAATLVAAPLLIGVEGRLDQISSIHIATRTVLTFPPVSPILSFHHRISQLQQPGFARLLFCPTTSFKTLLHASDLHIQLLHFFQSIVPCLHSQQV